MVIRWFIFPVALSLLAALGTACNHHSSSIAATSKDESAAWNVRTTVDVYNHAGFSNRAWDDQAQRCLSEYAQYVAGETDTNGPWSELISSNAAAAVTAGCADPLVNYLAIRYTTNSSNNKEAVEAAACKAARDLNNSSYPPIWKFHSAAFALDKFYRAYRTNSAAHPEKMEMLNDMYQTVGNALNDKTMPASEAYSAASLALYLTSGSAKNHASFYERMEKPLFDNWPNSSRIWLLKGNYFIEDAWKARGHGYANEVTPQGWSGFTNNLAVAREALEHGWTLDPKLTEIAVDMISVITDQDGDHDQMELWFNRAMEVDTNDFAACAAKLNYLAPKWFGSDEKELAFGRECVQSKKWGGRVPLILVDAHDEIDSRNEGIARVEYWKRPDVWADVQAAYERFFALNPDATGTYKNYARYAYRAEQWDKLNELLPKFGPADYNFFGGKEQFDKMVHLAYAHK